MKDLPTCQKCADEFTDGSAIARFLIVGSEDVGAFLLCSDCATDTLGVSRGEQVAELDTVQRATVGLLIAGVAGADLIDMTTRTMGADSLSQLVTMHSPEDDLDEIFEQVQKAEEKAFFLTPDNARTIAELSANLAHLELITSSFMTLAELIANGEDMGALIGHLDKSREAIDVWKDSFRSLSAKPNPEDVEGMNELHAILTNAQEAHERMTSARRAIVDNARARWGADASPLLNILEQLGDDD